jgi:hypothetical protein
MITDLIVDDFYKQWKNNGVVHIKNCVDDLPEWERILKMLNLASRETKSNIKYTTLPAFEISYMNILGVKKVEYNDAPIPEPKIKSDLTLFFSIFFPDTEVGVRLSESLNNQIKNINTMLNVDSVYNSLKISFSDKFVPYESHTWHTCIIQLKGINNWYLRDKRIGLEEMYIVEPGDILFFKEGVEHQISNEEPRSSLVGRFTFNEGGNKN